MFESTKQQLDDRGVSPVIGVILMVAITVILAAVIGSFVLGIGGDVEKAPQASLSLEESSDLSYDYELVHQGGDTLVYDEISLGDGESFTSTTTELGPGETWGTDDASLTIVHDPSDNVIAELEA